MYLSESPVLASFVCLNGRRYDTANIEGSNTYDTSSDKNLSGTQLRVLKSLKYIKNVDNVLGLPDPIIGGFFNLGESVAEQLSLEIEPFPRSIDVCFDGFSSSQNEQGGLERASPFAVLEQLKKK